MKHVVGFSGGIDSQACCLWVLNRYPKEDVIILNSDAGGNEHPMTTEHIAWFSENIHPVIMISPVVGDLFKKEKTAADHGYCLGDKLTFDVLAKIKDRFPSRTAQFCTQYLKNEPTSRWVKENLSGVEFERYSGIRRDESPARGNTVARCEDDLFGCIVNHPLFDWTKKMCFEYVQSHGQQINGLYKLGFDRVGCAPCINSSKADVRAWAQRFPEMIDKVRAWEKSVGKTFFAPCVPGLEINWIDQVVEWSMTTRGGATYDLLALEKRPACESAFGLCE